MFKMCSVECCPRTWSTVRNVTKDSLNCTHAISVGLGSQAPWLNKSPTPKATNQIPTDFPNSWGFWEYGRLRNSLSFPSRHSLAHRSPCLGVRDHQPHRVHLHQAPRPQGRWLGFLGAHGLHLQGLVMFKYGKRR